MPFMLDDTLVSGIKCELRSKIINVAVNTRITNTRLRPTRAIFYHLDRGGKGLGAKSHMASRMVFFGITN